MYKKVMIIDDTALDRFVAERVLTKFQFAEEVVAVESAIDALEYLAKGDENLPELIFLDINMPEMNGFEFLEAYKDLPLHVKSKCIIVMLTSSLNPADRQKADSCPYVRSYIAKPLNPACLNLITMKLAQAS